MKISVTELEDIIQSILRDSNVINRNKNLIELGLGSLDIMKIAGKLRKKGVKVTFGQLIKNPTITNWYSLINNQKDILKVVTSKVLEEVSVDIINNEDEEISIFPMTDVQYSYWVGRSDEQPLGGVGCHAYMEFDGQYVDANKLDRAWKSLFQIHPMLRARFYDGKQEVMENTEFDFLTVNYLDNYTEDEIEIKLEELRGVLSHRKLRTEEGENAGLTLSILPNGKTRIHFDIDMLVCDAQSIRIILRDLVIFYNRDITKDDYYKWNFGEYLKENDILIQKERESSKEYWDRRIETLKTGPDLPLKADPTKLKKSKYIRNSMFLKSDKFDRLKKMCNKYQVTPSMVLLTIYSEVLDRFSTHSKFLINIPLFNRNLEEKIAENAISDFTTIMLLEVDCAEKNSFIDNVKKVSTQFYKDMNYSSYSGVQVLRDLAKKYPGERDFAPVVFSCTLGTELIGSDFSTVFGELSYMISQTPQVWIDCQVFEVDGKLMLSWDTPIDLFPEDMVENMFKTFEKEINFIVSENFDWSTAIDIISDDQLEKIEDRTKLTLPEASKTLIEDFFINSSKYPEKIALIDTETGEKYTYGDLSEKALKIASLLREQGVKEGDKVAFTLHRGIKQIEATLGILSVGACYVPVSISQPQYRRELVHKNMDIRFVLIEEKSDDLIHFPKEVKKIFIEKSDFYTPINVVKVSPYSSSYVILTSGSTGEPKGVEISHYGAWNTIEEINKRYKVNEDDMALAVSAMDFDLSVYDVFGMLNAGGTIAILSEENYKNTSLWIDVINKYNISIWNSVPILMKMLLTYAEGKNIELTSLRVAMLSGDWIGLEIPEMLKKVAPYCKLVAMGGATEASIWSNYIEVKYPIPNHWVSIPYGQPLANQAYLVMDSKDRLCPDWVTGELWIGGAGVAKGYCGDLELTNKKFVDYKGERWYKTGDLGRFWSDGTIEFLGRTDFQVKIRGHRIELGEIENALKNNEGIKDAVIISTGEKQGEHHLVAYIVMNDGYEYDPEVICEDIEQRVPIYMVPAAFVKLDRIPITANGKVNRKELPIPQIIEDKFVVQETESEKIIAEIWRRLFKLDKVSSEDNFFKLGGDSLFGIRMVNELEKSINVEVSLAKIFEYPVLKGLARYIDSILSEKSSELPKLLIDKNNWSKEFPLSDIQYAYFIGSQSDMALGNTSTHCYFEFECEKLNINKLNSSWNELIKAHGMMRAIIMENGTQKILETVPEYVIERIDLSGENVIKQNEILSSIRMEMENQSFDSSLWPLFRIVNIVVSDTKEFIFILLDNIIFDGYSVFSIVEEWAKNYKGTNIRRKPLEVSYRDYVMSVQAIKNHDKYLEDKKYWLDKLGKMKPAPELPFKNSPDMIKKQSFIHLRDSIEKSQWQRIKKYANDMSITPSSVLVAVYCEVLARFSRKTEFSINLTQFNRLFRHHQINDIIGDFTTPIILTVSVDSENNFESRAKNIQKQILEDMSHPFFGGVEIQRELSKFTGGEISNIPVVFTSTLGLGTLDDGSLIGNLRYTATQTPQVWLDYQAMEKNGELYMGLEIVRELFEDDIPHSIFEAFLNTLHQLANDKELWMKDTISIVDINEVVNRESEKVEIPTETLDTLFVKQVCKNKGNIAVIQGGNTLNYHELFERAISVSKNIPKGSIVAILMEKGLEQVVATMGILMAGATYMPIDPGNPVERKRAILDCSKADIVLLQSKIFENEKAYLGDRKIYEVDEIEVLKANPEEYISKASNESAAYVIFTSGSTGIPKGVVVSHSSAINTIIDVNLRFNITESDRTIMLSNLNFDLSVYDIFGMLCTGGAVVIPDNERKRDPEHWVDIIERHNISVWNSVPAFMQMMTEYLNERDYKIFSKLKNVMLSGDWIPLSLPEAIRKAFSNEVNIISLGGATEAAIWSNYFVVNEISSGWKSIPYGYPLTNQKFRILNDMLLDCPANVPGKLYIGGAGLALEYLNDKAKTDEKFIIHPLTGERLYDTGDLGMFWTDGTMEFLGRDDFQVKIRGHRIELGEIETALRSIEEVNEALVIAYENKVGDKYLVGYVAADEKNFDSGRLAKLLNRCVPAYMVPPVFVRIDSIPISANGKIDRKMLPKPDENIKELVKPSTESELKLCKIWSKLFDIKQVSITDSYFILGGDSLMGIRLVSEISKEFNVKITLGKIFELPVLKDLALYIDSLDEINNQENLPKLIVDKASWEQPFTLTNLQNAYYIGSQSKMSLGGTSTHCYIELNCEDIDVKRLEKSLNELIKAQGMMRAIILPDGTQKILNDVERYSIERIDLSGLNEEKVISKRLDIRNKVSSESFDPTVWPLFSICLSNNGKGDDVLHLSFDNIIFDGWSVYYILNQLSNYYKNDDYKINDLEISYRDYVMSLSNMKTQKKYKDDEKYWLDRLELIYPKPDLPIKVDADSIDNHSFLHLKGVVNKSEWEKIKKSAVENSLTISSVLIASYVEALGRWCRSPKFTINLTQYNRLFAHKQINEVVGDFTTPLLLSVDVDDGLNFIDRVKSIQSQLVRDMEHPYYDGVLVQRELSRRSGEVQTIPVVFTSTVGFGSLNTEDLLGELVYTATQTPQIWIDLQVMEIDGDIEISFEAVKELFEEGLPKEILDGFMSVLNKLASNPESWYKECRSLVEINKPFNRELEKVEIPQLTLDQLFVENVIKRGDNPAIITSEKTLSYKEVFNYAYSISKYVKENSIVAIVMEKGWHQIVAALGVIMGGGAYMPIDPENPIERKKKIYESSEATLLLTQSWIKKEQLYIENENILCVDNFEVKTTIDVSDYKSKSGFEKRAYVIFTSGSTGLPKGVVISNHGAVNTILDVNFRFGINENDRTIAISNLNFDLSVYDIFGMFACGGAIVVPDHKKRKYPEHWLNLINKYSVTVWNSVPAFMQMLTEYSLSKQVKIDDGLKKVMLSGDWISLDLPEKIWSVFSKKTDVISLGGATEASIWSNYYLVKEVENWWRSIPYGYPLANQKFKILNKQLQDCPANVIGDLYIGGEGLAMCYLNDEEKTNDKFIIHPESGERLYDTGDNGRYWSDGTMEFIGRSDSQVKIRGHRIELGEIENALLNLKEIQNVTAFVAKDTNNKNIIASCIVPKSIDEYSEKKTVDYIGKLLPKYMIPDVYLVEERIPLTVNGKVDRKYLEGIVLHQLESKRVCVKENRVNVELTDTEKDVLAVWEEVLNVKNPDIENDFFDLGGDSVLIVKFTNILEERYGYEVSIGCVFDERDVKNIARAIDEGTSNN
ncbi:amino acid adenylation domain-containing protein [Clostridium paraputrificum]|uniref:non-ribosomal peptide synthetase n=1 Tax=Clostridium paraputrificum TaxID=29363 RepID=UPI003D352BBD